MKRALSFLLAGMSGLIAARAGVTLSLSPSLQNSAHGTEVVFSGTITNTSATDKVFLNDLTCSLSSASATYLTPSLNSFFANVPGILLPGETYSGGEIFHVVLGSSAPVNDYGGTITLSGGADIFATTSLASTSFTIRETPLDNWRFQNFGTAANSPAAADTADWDADGIKNLVEYALALAPKAPDRSALPAPFLDGDYLKLSYVPNAAATDVSYVVEASVDGAAWSTADVENVTLVNPQPPNRVTVRYKNPVSLTSRVFLRLSITRP